MPTVVERVAPNSMLAGYIQLERLHDQLDRAQDTLEAALRAPICVENCGRCCTGNTPTAWGIEVAYAVSWLIAQPNARKQALRLVRHWLEERALPGVPHPQRGPVPIVKDTLEKRLARELQAALKSRCPLLSAQKRCLVYDVRPISCRLYGLTVPTGPECPRPLGLGENLTRRAVYTGLGGTVLQRQMTQLLAGLEAQPELAGWEVFATGLYRRLRTAELERMAAGVATVKLLRGERGIPRYALEAGPAKRFVAPDDEGPVRLEVLK